ncbi:MAG: CYTH domain-containing protein [Alistipes sp.]|nr:CYTH domain-containing protein [Candidatus Alistipes equi]
MNNCEIERKFLVLSDAYKTSATSSQHICQGYLCSKKVTARIRIYGEKAYLTIKGKSRDGGLSRFEWEREIPLKCAEALLKRCSELIDKHRYIVPYRGYIYEVDEFHGENEGLILGEVELRKKDERPELPPWISDEVTQFGCFRNSYLAHHPISTWIKKDGRK